MTEIRSRSSPGDGRATNFQPSAPVPGEGFVHPAQLFLPDRQIQFGQVWPRAHTFSPISKLVSNRNDHKRAREGKPRSVRPTFFHSAATCPHDPEARRNASRRTSRGSGGPANGTWSAAVKSWAARRGRTRYQLVLNEQAVFLNRCSKWAA